MSIPPELKAHTWTERERMIYNIGYAEGGNDANVTWEVTLEDVLPPGGVATPTAVAEYIRRMREELPYG